MITRKQMIDLKGLNPTCDVTVGLCDGGVPIRMDFSPHKEKEMVRLDSFLNLNGIDCYRFSKSLTIFSGNHDPIQLAERIASGLEEQGLIVRRLIPEPGAKDRSPSKAIQSFILA